MYMNNRYVYQKKIMPLSELERNYHQTSVMQEFIKMHKLGKKFQQAVIKIHTGYVVV